MTHYENVAVFMGGWSAEREVSLMSGKAVADALERLSINTTVVDVNRNICSEMQQQSYSHVFNVLHGRGGEDGVIQGLLDVLGIPYTGSGVLGSALAMDKLRCKKLWQGIGLPTPDYRVLNNEEDCAEAIEALGLPLMVKPVLEGSSIGISKVISENEMLPSWRDARACGGPVIAEKFIAGEEYTAAILNDRVLPMVRLKADNEFYDYQAKYTSDKTEFFCPCGLDASFEAELAVMMEKSFKAVMGENWGRVDFMLDSEQQPWLIEVNTVPGMTSHSLVPIAAKQAGLSFDELVLQILQGASLRG
ncbi:D-alanine--D-alanine ligase [hydrothermal vent metagenome]|uniref:D-alanine--D-alanine ligase n=1 Tax=hydrothermal vent metagenome TaxID=652676 RepID=A0A3B0X7E4_9ZZZZ